MRRYNRPRTTGALLFLAGVFLPAALGGVASGADTVLVVVPATGLIVLGALVLLCYWPAR